MLIVGKIIGGAKKIASKLAFYWDFWGKIDGEGSRTIFFQSLFFGEIHEKFMKKLVKCKDLELRLQKNVLEKSNLAIFIVKFEEKLRNFSNIQDGVYGTKKRLLRDATSAPHSSGALIDFLELCV